MMYFMYFLRNLHQEGYVKEREIGKKTTIGNIGKKGD